MSERAILCGHCSSRRTILPVLVDGRGTLVCLDCGWRMPAEETPDGRLLIHPDPEHEPPLDQRLRAAGAPMLPGFDS